MLTAPRNANNPANVDVLVHTTNSSNLVWTERVSNQVGALSLYLLEVCSTGHLIKHRKRLSSPCFVSLVGRIFQDYVVDPLAEGMWDNMRLLRGPFGNTDVLKVHDIRT